MNLLVKCSLDKLLKNIQVDVAVEKAKKTNRHTLILSSFKIDNFPKGILQLEYLYKLSLSKNDLKSLPEEISCLENLNILSLDYNNLTILPHGLFTIITLRKLNLSHNPLQKLSPMIGHLINLEVLWLNKTELKAIPSQIKYLTSLDTFGARGNFLDLIPNELLEIESISGNNISELNRTKWKNLIHLNLSLNQFEELPQSLTYMENLRYCFFNDNPLKKISASVLDGLSHLNLLNIRDCGTFYIDHPYDETIYEEEYFEENESDESEDWLDSINSSNLNSSGDEENEITGDLDPLIWLPITSKFTQL